MTAPIQEPTTDRALQGLAYARDQIFRRPPTGEACPCTAAVWMGAWQYDTDPVVPNETWTPVAHFATGGGYYGETVVVPADQNSLDWDYQSGIVELLDDALYSVSAWVKYEEDAQVDDEYRVIAIHRVGGSVRVMAPWIFQTAEAGMATNYLPVHTHWIRGGGFSTELQVQLWQNSGVSLNIEQSEFLVRRFEYWGDDNFVINDPFE